MIFSKDCSPQKDFSQPFFVSSVTSVVQALFLLSPLYPPAQTPISLCTMIIGALFLLLNAHNKKSFSAALPTIHHKVITLSLITLFALMAASVLWSEGVPTFAVAGQLLFSGFCVGLFILITAGLCRLLPMQTILLVAALAAGAVALLSLGWQLGVNDRSLSYRAFRIASAGLGEWANLGNPIDAGLYYGPFALVLLCALITPLQTSFRFTVLIKALSAIGLVSLVGYLVLTYSRGAMAAFLVGSCVLCGLSGSRYRFVWLLTVLLGCAGLVAFGESLLNAEVHKGFNGREPIWEYALHLIQQKPWLGHGAGQVFDYVIPPHGITYHFAHNYLLTLWVHYGIGAPLLFLMATGSALWLAWQNRQSVLSRLSMTWLVFGLVGIQTYVDELMRTPHPYWLLVWFPLGLCLGSHKLKST